jgi:hypothetical protein
LVNAITKIMIKKVLTPDPDFLPDIKIVIPLKIQFTLKVPWGKEAKR